jgi:simple sugar transport system substrate-binding protein
MSRNSVLFDRCGGFEDAINADRTVAFSGTIKVPIDNSELHVSTVLDGVGADRSWDSMGILVGGQPQISNALLVKAEKPEVIMGTLDVSEDLYTALDKGLMQFGISQNSYLQGYMPIPILTYKACTKQQLANPVIASGPGFVTESPSDD